MSPGHDTSLTVGSRSRRSSDFAMVGFRSLAVAKTVFDRRDGTLFQSPQPVIFRPSSAAELLAMLLPSRASRWTLGQAAELADVVPLEFEEMANECRYSALPAAAARGEYTGDRAWLAFSDMLDQVRALRSSWR